MNFNDIEIENISFNGILCDEIYFNGVKVFQKKIFSIYDYYDNGYSLTTNKGLVTFTIKSDELINIKAENNTGTGRLVFFGSWSKPIIQLTLDETKEYKVILDGESNDNIKLMFKRLKTNGGLATNSAIGGATAIVSSSYGLTYMSLDVLDDNDIDTDYKIIIEEVAQ